MTPRSSDVWSGRSVWYAEAPPKHSEGRDSVTTQEDALCLERIFGFSPEFEELQRAFDAAPDYVRRVTGRGPTGGEARELWELIPSGFPRYAKQLFILRSGTRVIGCLDLLLGYPGDGRAFLGLLLLSEESRGRGLGRAAYESCERMLRSHGIERVRLGVLATNLSVAPFWELLGFEQTGETASYTRGAFQSEVVLFEKSIAPRSAPSDGPSCLRRRIRFVSDELVEEIIAGTKTASMTRLGEVDLIEDEFDDPLYVGELYDVFDSHGARRAAIRILAMELCRWDAVPKRLWRGEGNDDAEGFRRDHVSYVGDPTPDTEFVAYYFERVPTCDSELELRIRPYSDGDWDAVCEVHDRARPVELESLGPPKGFAGMAEVAEADRFYEGRTFVATSGDSLVGFVTIENEELTWLYVEPSLRGRGIGRALVEHVLPMLGRDAFLLCAAGNLPARRFYEECGFVLAAEFPGSAEGIPTACVRLCLPWSRHRDRPPTPTPESLRLAGYPENAPGHAVRDEQGVWRWTV